MDQNKDTIQIEESDLKNLESKLPQGPPKVTKFWADKYSTEASKNWDKFYKRNTTKFFKDRHWINREFSELPETLALSEQKFGLEVGCGVGNFIYPVLAENPKLTMYACDFSPRAVEFVKEHEDYQQGRCIAFVADITKDELTTNVPANKIDFLSLIFVLSAISPDKFLQTIINLSSVAKPGCLIFFRDYGYLDAAQIRFKTDNWLGDNQYVRQDGTLTYYFKKEELESLFESQGYETVEIEYVIRETTNVKRELSTKRIFLQAKFRKL